MEGKNLVIVESPGKVKTIQQYLGKEYLVKASIGHIRDLEEHKLGVDIEHGFIPEYGFPGFGTMPTTDENSFPDFGAMPMMDANGFTGFGATPNADENTFNGFGAGFGNF